MTLFKAYGVGHWPQNILNGFLRPNTFFRDSPWEGESWWSVIVISFFALGSYFISCEVHLQNGISDWKVMAAFKYVLSFVVFSFLVSTFLDAIHKLVQIRGSMIEYLCFTSFISMSYFAMNLVFFFHKPIFLFMQILFIPWVFTGFLFSFGKLSSAWYRTGLRWLALGLLACFLYPVELMLANWVRSSGLPLSEDGSLLSRQAKLVIESAAPQVNAVLGRSPKATQKEVKEQPYTKRSLAKKGDVYQYEVRFRRNSKIVFGKLNIKYLNVYPNEQKAKVEVRGSLGKKSFYLKREISEMKTLSDLNLLNTDKKVTLNTALRILVTSHLSVEKVPKYYTMGWTAFVRDTAIRESRVAGIRGYYLTKVPNAIFMDQDKLRFKQNIFMSKRAALPLLVEGQIPHNKVWYTIQLKKKVQRY